MIFVVGVDYWTVAGETRPYEVRVLSTLELDTGILTKRCLELTQRYKEKQEKRRVLHFRFNGWESYPPEPSSFVSFITHVDDARKEMPNFVRGESQSLPPIVVQDVMGIGKTGVFIAVDILKSCIDYFGLNCHIDIAKLVLDLRDKRSGMVQLSGQYEFIYRCLYCVIQRQTEKERLASSRILGHDYGNMDNVYSTKHHNSFVPVR
jgi:protein tyrosine phosphatase